MTNRASLPVLPALATIRNSTALIASAIAFASASSGIRRFEKEAKKAAPVNEVTAEVKSTLGDLDALVELKKKMEEGK